MQKVKITNTQRKILRELDEIADILGMNFREIEEVENEARIPVLKNIKDQYVRGEVIIAYALIDEFLSSAICHYFFGKKKGFIKLWRTKKFKNFNYYVLEKLYLLNKLDLVKTIFKIPREIENAIKRVNDLRNGLAHSFFPENLRRNKPIYKDKSIYSMEGLKLFVEDKEKINDFFLKKLYNIEP
jgi:hypothetical protein